MTDEPNEMSAMMNELLEHHQVANAPNIDPDFQRDAAQCRCCECSWCLREAPCKCCNAAEVERLTFVLGKTLEAFQNALQDRLSRDEELEFIRIERNFIYDEMTRLRTLLRNVRGMKITHMMLPPDVDIVSYSRGRIDLFHEICNMLARED